MYKLILLLGLFIFFVPSFIHAQEILSGTEPTGSASPFINSHRIRYFERHEEGWFWYEIIPEEDEPFQPEDPLIEQMEEKPTQPSAEKLTVTDIKKRGEELLNQAILEPTPENVQAYMLHNKWVLDRSQQFAEVWRKVLWEHPELDSTVKKPTSTLGIELAGKAEIKEANGIINRIGELGKLVFFYTTTCPYCKEQSRILKIFSDNYGLNIMPVSLDGGALPEWPDFEANGGQAQALGVTQVPALFIFAPPDKIVRLGTGFMTYDELEKRLFILGKEVLGLEENQFPANEDLLRTNQKVLDSEQSFLNQKEKAGFEFPGGIFK